MVAQKTSLLGAGLPPPVSRGVQGTCLGITLLQHSSAHLLSQVTCCQAEAGAQARRCWSASHLVHVLHLSLGCLNALAACTPGPILSQSRWALPACNCKKRLAETHFIRLSNVQLRLCKLPRVLLTTLLRGIGSWHSIFSLHGPFRPAYTISPFCSPL